MNNKIELIRRLSLPMLVFYGIGTILGAGIYVPVGKVAGEAVYMEEGFGVKQLSIAVGLMIVSIGVISVAAMAHGFAGYLNVFFEIPEPVIVISLIVLIGLVCGWGIGLSVFLASAMTIVEIIGLLIILYLLTTFI